MGWEHKYIDEVVDDNNMYWDYDFTQSVNTMMVNQEYQTYKDRCLNKKRSDLNEKMSIKLVKPPERSTVHEPDHLTSVCRHFFTSWLQRSESLRGRWQREPPPLSSFDHKIQHLRNEIAELAAQDTQLFHQLFALQDSIDALKDQLEVETTPSNWSSHSSSPCYLSPASSSQNISSLLQLPAGSDSGCEPSSITSAPDSCNLETTSYQQHLTPEKPKRRSTLVAHTSFVRQRVSYPPSARNRCRRSQTLQSHILPPQHQPRRPRSVASMHEENNSLDSGIHTSDHEIFV